MMQKFILVLAMGMCCTVGLAQEKKYRKENGFEWYEVTKRVNGEKRYGVEDRNGNVIVPTEYTQMWYRSDPNPLLEGFGPHKGKYMAWYAKSGECIVPYTRGYTRIVKWDKDEFGIHYTFEKPEGGGILDKDGREIVFVNTGVPSAVFIRSTKRNGKKFYFLSLKIEKDGKEYSGIADATGKIIVMPEYKDYLTALDLAMRRLKTTINPLVGTKHDALAETHEKQPGENSSFSSLGTSSSSNNSSKTQRSHVYSEADYIKACVLTWDGHFNDGCAVVRYYGARVYINDQGVEILPSDRNMANNQDYSEGLKSMSKSHEYERDLRFGFVDKQGKYVIYDIYENSSVFSEGLAYVKGGIYNGFIDKTGELVVKLREEYSEVKPFKDGMAAVRKNDKWGFVDKHGFVSVPVIYEEVCDFSEGLAAVDQNGKCGFVDKKGRMVIPTKYAPISARDIKFKNGYAEVFKYGYERGFADIAMEVRVEFDGYGSWTDPSSIFTKTYNYHKIIIDKRGNEIKDAKSISGLEGVYTYGTGINLIPEGSMCFGLKSLNGNVILAPSYGYIGEFNNGLALVFKNNKAGFIDKQGNNKIQCKYDDGNVFSEGIAAVKRDRKWGYINTQGKEITPFIFDEARPCKGGFACVKIGDRYGFVSNSGAPLNIKLSGNTEFMAGEDEDRFWKPEDPSTNEYLDKAIVFYKKGADKGDINSCFKLGYYSFMGAGTMKKNYAEAVKWFTKCQTCKQETNGNDYLYLGYCYAEGGFGITKDKAKAFQAFKKGADAENDACYNALISCYLEGFGCTKNVQEACKLADVHYNRRSFDYYRKEQILPIYGQSYNTLAYEYAHKSNYTQAFATIDKLIYTISELLNSKKKDIEQLKKNDRLVEELSKSINNLNNMIGNAYDSKGEFYLMKGDIDMAMSMWKKVMEYDNKNLEFYKQNSALYKQLKVKGYL